MNGACRKTRVAPAASMERRQPEEYRICPAGGREICPAACCAGDRAAATLVDNAPTPAGEFQEDPRSNVSPLLRQQIDGR
jgi:hypothetical protein